MRKSVRPRDSLQLSTSYSTRSSLSGGGLLTRNPIVKWFMEERKDRAILVQLPPFSCLCPLPVKDDLIGNAAPTLRLLPGSLVTSQKESKLDSPGWREIGYNLHALWVDVISHQPRVLGKGIVKARCCIGTAWEKHLEKICVEKHWEFALSAEWHLLHRTFVRIKLMKNAEHYTGI